MMRSTDRRLLALGVSILPLVGSVQLAFAQTILPELTVIEPTPAVPKLKKPKTAIAKRSNPSAVQAKQPASAPIDAAQSTTVSPAAGTPAQALAAKTAPIDQTRANILPHIGTNSYDLGAATIAAQPQGANASIEKTLLQTPGFSQDSAASGAFHLRNEHANVQFRINGILLPDGVSGFSQVIDSGLIGDLQVLTGALPAQYGLHTSGVIDITTKSGAFNNGGSVSVYGGSLGTITPSLDYGGTVGDTQYFVTGRYLGSNEGIENPAPSVSAIHDHTDQGKFFGYASTILSDGGRLSFITGTDIGKYQIPNSPGQTPNFTVPVVGSFDSSQVNETQTERNFFNVASYQKSLENLDFQLSAYSRYSSLHFVPDPIGDLVFNGVASDVTRTSFLNGASGDAALRINDAHTLRFGFSSSVESAQSRNTSTVFPVDAFGNQAGDPFAAPVDSTSKLGYLLGVYLQDEWRITDRLTLNGGLRFDQMYQYTNANQLSPRVSLTYKPFDNTTIHAGYARYFTPPELALSGPTNLGLYTGTTLQPAIAQNDTVQPERSNVYDIGIDQKLAPGLTAGIDAYFKQATDLLDDGQFGQALTLTAFNYAKGINRGVEGKIKYDTGNLQLYGNVAWGTQKATNIISNQYLFDPDEFAYISSHSIPTDHAQQWSGSAGASYKWNDTRFSVDAIFGSGLRDGFANTATVPGYTQVNAGVSQEIKWSAVYQPATIRFDVVNVFDHVYEIRDGSGIGVFAPQYAARRGFFVGFSQAL